MGRKWATKRDFVAQHQRLSERRRKDDIARLRAGLPGDPATSLAMVSDDGSGLLVQDPTDSNTWWMPWTDEATLHEVALDAGWGLVDHLGTGKRTMLVPPTAGRYAAGSQVGITIFGTSPTSPYLIEGSLAIIGGTPGSYYVEYAALTELTRFPTTSSVNPSFNNTVMAPQMLAEDNREVGFGWYAYITASPAPTAVHPYGFNPRLWAYSV